MIKKLFLFVVILAINSVGLDGIDIQNTYIDDQILTHDHLNGDNDSCVDWSNRIIDSMDVKFVRFEDLEDHDSTLDYLAIDTLRGNPDVDSISGYPRIDSAHVGWLNVDTLRGNPDVDSISGYPRIDSAHVGWLNVDTLRGNPDIDSISGYPRIDSAHVGWLNADTIASILLGGRLFVDTIRANSTNGIRFEKSDGSLLGTMANNGDLDWEGDLDVIGDIYAVGILDISDAATLSSTVDILGDVTISANVDVESSYGATSTPRYIDLGDSYSDGVTRDKLKIYLHNYSASEKYGFGVGSSGDIQYHSNVSHDLYINNSRLLRAKSTGLQLADDSYIGIDSDSTILQLRDDTLKILVGSIVTSLGTYLGTFNDPDLLELSSGLLTCAGTLNLDELQVFDGISNDGYVVHTPSSVTISSNTISVSSASKIIKVATEGGAALDTIASISGGNGQMIILFTDNSSNDVFIQEGSNIKTSGSGFTLDDEDDTIMFFYYLYDFTWKEVSRSDNN